MEPPMRLDKPRIPALQEDQWTEEQKALLEPQKMRGRVQNIFRTMANHTKLAKRWLVFGNHILSKSTLPPRDREILILRIGWLCKAGYEWGQHVVIGKHVGIKDNELEMIKQGPDAGWSTHDALLIRAADELHNDAFVSDPTWQGLKQAFSDQQMMDLVFTCGQYTMVSMALNSFGVQLDPDIKGF
ncbi:MAG: 4-carboxymuconolactone decarboxylase [Candidatus Azotimanducaceae bacterium]|jgi:4-carboxymuconolactone decarboxylase